VNVTYICSIEHERLMLEKDTEIAGLKAKLFTASSERDTLHANYSQRIDALETMLEHIHKVHREDFVGHADIHSTGSQGGE